jgi:hypothetical protein
VRGQGLVLSTLTDGFRALAAWPAEGDLPPEEWERYIATAAEFQRAEPTEIEAALDEFLRERSGLEAARDETRLFLLQRVVFDLPEKAPESERRPFKGWTNWPAPDADGNVSIAWPITWRDGRPALVAPYEGSEGRPYNAVGEYRHFLEHYPLRALAA